MAATRLASLIVLSLVPLTGCSLLHSNIKGGFACAAPHGTCAPSMTIDDAAITAIGGQHVHDGEKPTADAATQAGGKQAWNIAPGGRPALKVVFPAWRDGTGQWHPRTAAYTPLDVPPSSLADAAPLDGHVLGASQTASLLVLAEMAPEIAALAAPPSAVPMPMPMPVSDDRLQISAANDSKAMPQMQPTAGGAGPLDTIKAEVKQILSAGAKMPAGKDLAPQTSAQPAKPAASFPPAGN